MAVVLKFKMIIMRFIVAKLDPRIRNAIKNLYDEIRILRNHNKGVYYVKKRLDKQRSLRVQFGCGPERKRGWLNTDIWPGPWATPDICLDASRKLPFRSNSVAEIYSEHMFEHLDYPDAVSLFLAECFRVLEIGGVITIGVPDVDIIFERYRSSMSRNTRETSILQHSILGHPLEELNFSFHQAGEHKFLYSADFIIDLLFHFGFSDPHRREFESSMDSEHRRNETLYVVALKR